jgi:hypothetical protein
MARGACRGAGQRPGTRRRAFPWGHKGRSGQPDPEGSEEHEAEVVLRGLVEASGGSPEALEAAEEVFDEVTLFAGTA